MDYGKLDSALAIALGAGGDPDEAFTVFVHSSGAPTSPVPPEVLAKLGTTEVAPGVYTATMTRQELERLSDQEWVRSLRLSPQRHPH